MSKQETDHRIKVVVCHVGSGQEGIQHLPCHLKLFANLQDVYVLAATPRPSQWPVVLRFERLTQDELTQAPDGSCLCCSMRSEIAAFLAKLFMAMLARIEKPVKYIVVVTESKGVDALRQTLTHTPFLAQRYVFDEMNICISSNCIT